MPNNVNLQITNNPSYIFYIDKNRVADLEGKFVGKWMYFFNNSHVAFAESICKKAVILPLLCKGGDSGWRQDPRQTSLVAAGTE